MMAILTNNISFKKQKQQRQRSVHLQPVHPRNDAATAEQQGLPLTKNKWPHRRDTKRLEINKAAKRREPNVRGLSSIERNYRSV